jgi:flagellar biosynthesis protein FliR
MRAAGSQDDAIWTLRNKRHTGAHPAANYLQRPLYCKGHDKWIELETTQIGFGQQKMVRRRRTCGSHALSSLYKIRSLNLHYHINTIAILIILCISTPHGIYTTTMMTHHLTWREIVKRSEALIKLDYKLSFPFIYTIYSFHLFN